MSFGVLTKTACTKFSKILQNYQGFKISVFSHALPDSIIFTSFHILMVIPPYKPCSLSLRSTISHISQMILRVPFAALCQSRILRHLRSSHGSVTFTSGAALEGSKRHQSADFSRSWASFSATNPPILYSPFVHVALTLTWCKRPVVPQLHLSLRSSRRTTS